MKKTISWIIAVLAIVGLFVYGDFPGIARGFKTLGMIDWKALTWVLCPVIVITIAAYLLPWKPEDKIGYYRPGAGYMLSNHILVPGIFSLIGTFCIMLLLSDDQVLARKVLVAVSLLAIVSIGFAAFILRTEKESK